MDDTFAVCERSAMSQPDDPIAGLSAQVLKDKFSLSKGYASDLINRKRRPSLDLAVRIEHELGVPASAWVVADDKAA